jgi:hypothetical protein
VNQKEDLMMKKLVLVTSVMALVFSVAAVTTAGKGADKKDCTRIQDGILADLSGDLITVGFNGWGYNYQAHVFKGYYCDAYRNADWCQDFKDDSLAMKWNDAWLSNMDCDGDGLLDRHLGFDSVKIVAVPSDAKINNGIWYTADGEKIGAEIWGAFAIIQEVLNDPCAGNHGVQFVSPVGPGLGKF